MFRVLLALALPLAGGSDQTPTKTTDEGGKCLTDVSLRYGFHNKAQGRFEVKQYDILFPAVACYGIDPNTLPGPQAYINIHRSYDRPAFRVIHLPLQTCLQLRKMNSHIWDSVLKIFIATYSEPTNCPQLGPKPCLFGPFRPF